MATIALAATAALPAGATVPPAAAAPTSGQLFGLACQPGRCVATGVASDPGGAEASTSWSLLDGRWTAASVGATGSEPFLESVSCASGASCLAVGQSAGTSSVGVAEQLARGAWTPLALPSGTPPLRSVSCVTATWCVAVGATAATPSQPTALLWDGTTWRALDVAATPDYGVLEAVTCRSTTFCMAVGYSESSMLAESFDGSTWSIVSPPPVLVSMSWLQLRGVACTSDTSCVAVGSAGGCCDAYEAVTLSWDGTTWANVASPTTSQVALSSVSCPSATSCLAVGSHGPFDGEAVATVPIVWSWDGTAWSAVAGSAFGADGWLDAVACTRVGWCAAVGGLATAVGGAAHPLVERYDGTSLARMWAPS